MSYILDALKKAERERHAARIPTLETVHRAPWERRRPQWMWIGAAVVVVNAALLIWFLRPERMAETSPASPASTPATMSRPLAPAPSPDAPAPMSPAAAVTTPPEPEPSLPSTSRRAPGTTAKRLEAKAEPPAAVTPVAPRLEPRKPQVPDAPARPTPATPKVTAPPAVAERVPPAAAPDTPASPPVAASATKPVERGTAPLPGLQELTPADQEGMPKISLQFLVYSDVPAERLVFINNQKYVEGQSIEGKVVVEGIAPDGAILSYQGKRFKLRQ
jgi:general secretion pathway protein B